MFWASLAIIAALLVPAAIAADPVTLFFNALQAGIVKRFGWLYVVSMTGFLGFVVWLILSRFGAIRLGPDDAKPDFSRPTWFAMLFSAGVGIGLLFFGVAEPIFHYSSPPDGGGPTVAGARQAMALTFFHWGLHPWAAYAVVGLALAYFSHRRGLPLSIRSAFHPLLGDRIHGPIGNAIDTVAVVSTLFGVATSLGLGAMQVNAGLNHVAGLPETVAMQTMIIAAITCLATVSVVSGIGAGIRRLSELNMVLAGALLLFILVAGPTLHLIRSFGENVVAYLAYLPRGSLGLADLDDPVRGPWLASWTIFYWAWWIAWAPFVGMSIARISRGRTIREFLLAVLLAPTLASFVWLTIFGDTALHQEIHGMAGIVAAVQDSVPTAIFVLLDRLPVPEVTAVICTASIVLFFVTSSDSASLVVDTLASGGALNPPVAQRVFWAILEGVVAATLLFAGGLKALQTAAITTALPFCVILIGMCVALAKGLRAEEP